MGLLDWSPRQADEDGGGWVSGLLDGGWADDAAGSAASPANSPAARLCAGIARVLQGNPRLVGKGGAFDTGPSNLDRYAVTADSAAVVPAQFGLTNGSMRGIIDQISGTLGDGTTFGRVRDAVDDLGQRQKLGLTTRQFQDHMVQRATALNGGVEPLLLELVGAPKDLGLQSVTLSMPAGYACPRGTR